MSCLELCTLLGNLSEVRVVVSSLGVPMMGVCKPGHGNARFYWCVLKLPVY